MARLLMTYAEVLTALQDAGLRYREARLSLRAGRECVAPHTHGLHSQRRWLRRTVESYCETLATRA